MECLMKTVNVWKKMDLGGEPNPYTNKRMKSKSYGLPIMAPQDLFLPVFSVPFPLL